MTKTPHEFGFMEAKQSGGAVYELGVKQSRYTRAIRRIAEPMMQKHWHNEVTNLHRIYRVAEYLYTRSRRENTDTAVKQASIGSFFRSCLSPEERRRRRT